MQYNWKIGGEAGFGIMTSGLVFSKIAVRSGYYIFDYAEYPSLIRGGHNTYEVAISNKEINSTLQNVDLLVCLNKETFDNHHHRLTSSSYVIYDPDQFEFTQNFQKIKIPFTKIKNDQKIQQQMLNSVAVAASIYFLGGESSLYDNIIMQEFGRKGNDIVSFNLNLAKIGRSSIDNSGFKPLEILKQKENFSKKIAINGNEMFSLACIPADCRHYASYPMTPASSILSTLAQWQYETGMVVRHPEDEIAVINSALGSSFAGARSAVGTSGGGFALMVEALSFAGIAEIPVVVFLSMRPGPATGMPTWTEQGDLLFAVNAGHGEFPKIILSPGDPSEMAALTLKAFDLSDIYQTPVIILSDKLLSESHYTVEKNFIEELFEGYTPKRGKIVEKTTQEKYLRYKFCEDGVSEMLLPGYEGAYYQANSYEHLQDSHTDEDDKTRKHQVEKRNTKIQTYFKNHFKEPTFYADTNAETIFISWGSMKGPILESITLLKEETNESFGFVHFTHIYPLDETVIQNFFAGIKDKRLILVENNSQAQFGQLLRQQTGIEIKEKLLKYDGRPFFSHEIKDYVLKTLNVANKNNSSQLGVAQKMLLKFKKIINV